MSDLIQEQGVQPAPQLIRYCRRCHRKLRNEDSMKKGYGPICLQKEVTDRKAQRGEDA
jgi:hypothetical protein